MKISACWIAKNEAEGIAMSIMSVKDCVDEMIVIDSDSVDDTVRIAKEHGARVENFDWIEDFSAARNFCLSMARGEYIIFLDADEYFYPALNKSDRGVICDWFEKTKSDVIQILRVEIEVETGSEMAAAPYGRLMKRKSVRYKGRIHELPALKNGGVPRVTILEGYRIMHTGYSSDRINRKLLRNIKYLESEQSELTDELSLFQNKAYLLREYMALGEFSKAFENCRYIMDNHEQWKKVAQIFSFNYIQRFYMAINLATIKRFWFSRKEIYLKLFGELKKCFCGSREAMLADLYYQMIFDYREDRFLRELELVEAAIKDMPPSAINESKQAEAAIFGRAAVAMHYRGDIKKAGHYAQIALSLVPESNTEIMKALIDNTPFDEPYPEIYGLLMNKEYEKLYNLIVCDLERGKLDYKMLEFLLIVAEKTSGELSNKAWENFEIYIALLNEAIDLSDVINTGFICEDEPDLSFDLLVDIYKKDKLRPVTPDVLTLHKMAIPTFEKNGRPVIAMRSCLLLAAKGIEPEKFKAEFMRLAVSIGKKLSNQPF